MVYEMQTSCKRKKTILLVPPDRVGQESGRGLVLLRNALGRICRDKVRVAYVRMN